MKVIVVTGSRDYMNRMKIITDLSLEQPDIVIHGDAPGADRMADEWAEDFGAQRLKAPAPWARGRSAGPQRNKFMTDLACLLREAGHEVKVLAYPLPSLFGESKGTRGMMKLCRAAGLPVLDREEAHE